MTITATTTYQPPDVTVTTTETITGPYSTVYQRRDAQPNRSPLPVALAIFASSRISSAAKSLSSGSLSPSREEGTGPGR